ncbi:MAG: hypothetical protein ABEL04_01860 [Salinibacter sp.]|uniref:hypothetical protein n=1 Tax=Salinibacter sp. TaxID=2065818 RepID=UPI0035D4356A
MASSTAPSSQFDAPDFDSEADDTFPSAQLPLRQPVADVEEAVRTLEGYPPDELRRARKHHRRALEALRDNAYNALSGDTRKRLVRRFRTNLRILNKALDAADDSDADRTVGSSPQSTS